MSSRVRALGPVPGLTGARSPAQGPVAARDGGAATGARRGPTWARAGRPAAGEHRARAWGPLRSRRSRAVQTRSTTAVLAEVAGALRVGAPPSLAWYRAGVRAGPDGVPTVDDVARVGALEPRHAGAVVAACRLAAELGAPPVALLEQVTLAVVRDAEARDRRAAALAGPRATARLLAWLPLGGLGLGLSLGADPLGLLLRPGAGPVLLVVGAGLTAAGHAWTRRELSAAARAAEDDR